MNNREKLIDLMIDNSLERRELAELVHVDRAVVDSWLASPESTRNIEVPDMAIELLLFKLDDANRVSVIKESRKPG